MMSEIKCPKCGSNHVLIERRPDGDCTCAGCKYKWKNQGSFCDMVPRREYDELQQQLQAAEQQNAQLRADLAQREAEGAGYRAALEKIATGRVRFASQLAEEVLSKIKNRKEA